MKKYLLLGIVFGICILFVTFTVDASQAGKAYAEADRQLNQVYQELVLHINNSGDRQRLKTAQKAWIQLRDRDVNFYKNYYVNSKGGLFLRTKMTEERTAYLKEILHQPPQQQNDDVGPF